MACSPATPTPMMNTRAAAIVPAAVIIIGKRAPVERRRFDHGAIAGEVGLRSTARPSICAREMRGMNSIASASILALASFSITPLSP